VDNLPPQVDRRIKKALKALDVPWQLVKKKDHYFVQIGDEPLICIADNASKNSERRVQRTLHRIKKI
jgi:hypothetical protein